MTTTGTAALAAPTGFTSRAAHAGGTGATAVQATGSMSWSSSLKTVTLTNVKLFVKGGECGWMSVTGYQGDNAVTDTYLYPNGSYFCPSTSTTLSLGTISRTAGVPGGITDLLVLVYDETHTVTGYADCYQTDSSCQTGQF